MPDGATCVTKATNPTYNGTPYSVYVAACISGHSTQGNFGSCVYYAVVPLGASVIQGRVTGPHAVGVSIRASGQNGTHASATTVSGPDGFFAVPVPAGSYVVDPAGAGFKPATANVTVRANATTNVSFAHG
jgi:hypothetical protein